MTQSLKAFFAAACAVAALAAAPVAPCAHGAPAALAHAPVLRHYAALVHATYADALSSARALQYAVQRFVAEPSDATLDEARQAWRTAREWYGQSEAFRFSGGPIDNPGRSANQAGSPEGRLNAWPIDEAYLDVAGPAPERGLIHDTSFVIDKANLVACNERDGEENVCTGWHAIEYLLWGPDRSDTGPGKRSVEDFVDANSNHAARRRAWLSVATDLLVDDLTGLADAWAPGGRPAKAARKPNFRASFERSGEPAIQALLQGLATLSRRELAADRIEVPLKTEDQRDETSNFSDNTHRDLINNTLGVQNVWLGRYVRADGSTLQGPGLRELVAERDAPLAARITQSVHESVQAALAIEPPFDREIIGAADAPGRLRLQRLVDSLIEQSRHLLAAARVFDVRQRDASRAGAATPGAAVAVRGRYAFSVAAAALTDEERSRFAAGHSTFKRNWVEAQSSTLMHDGVGPHFNAHACAGCHLLDGRGAMPAAAPGAPSAAPAALVIRLSIPGVPQGGAGVVPEPVYGEHLNKFAVEGVKPEGRVAIARQQLRGRFADGTPYVLQQPRYSVVDLAYGPLAPDVRLSPRLAPQLMGVGLLESIAEDDIVKNAARQAATWGPIKGQVNRVWDMYAERELIGRFGWKANAATLRHQTAAAFLGDMGITSPRLVRQACTYAQSDCLAARAGGWKGRPPEITDAVMDDVVFYQAALAPAAQREPQSKQVRQGAALFAQAQCAACHRPGYTTGDAAFLPVKTKALQGQRIWPYTDLLLHDMGPDLADGRPDHQASASQWKTPPLWGIGLLQEVNGQTRLMHDGRADGVLEAILWHGGEAQAAKDAVLRFSAAQRAALVRFVMSL